MKILFLCGSLEAGRDGVGDYTRRLAGEVIRKGHEVSIAAINDQHITGSFQSDTPPGKNDFSILRLSSSFSSKLRFEALKKWSDDFEPDWISLQYVPYAFHGKGIPLRLGSFLGKLNTRSRWHIMIHEPYLGKQQSLKNKFIRLSQMISLRLIKRNLKPAVVHTSITQYQKSLQEISINSKLLGLFGNIDIQQTRFHLNGQNPPIQNIITGIYFGSAPAPRYHPVFAQKLKVFCAAYQSPLQLIICGKSGQYGKQFAEKMAEACENKSLKISFLGEMDAVALSNLFLQADFGISRTSPGLIGKSGSAIAMLEHGLPLWIPVLDDTVIKNLDFRPDLCFYELADILQSGKRKKCINRLPDIADKFLTDLN